MAKQVVIEKVHARKFDLEHIRNISVIAHVDHGKSTLSDALVSRGGLLSEERSGHDRWTDFDPEEKARGITIQSTSVSLPFDVPVRVKNVDPIKWTGELAAQAKQAKEDRAKTLEDARKLAKEQKKNDAPSTSTSTSTSTPTSAPTSSVVEPIQEPEKVITPFLVNLIDSPGHIDFSSEVTAALRVTDGALVVVDCVEGVCVQTETVLRQALAERIKPVLFLNKLDRLFFELDKDPEEIYQKLVRTIESVNVVIATYHDELLGDVSVHPQAGSVGFGSGKQGWGFTLEYFAELYHHKFNIPVKKMMKKLWGDNFWDPKSNRWSTKSTNEQGRSLERGFNMLILEPLKKLFGILKEDNKADELKKFLDKVNVVMDQETLQLTDKKKLTEAVMKKWIPVADSMLQLIVQHLPSPVDAQKYRVQNLYSGPLDDEAATSIRNCDPNGPLVMYVSKMVPTSDFSRFYAFGRIFSGSVRSGQMVRIQGPSYVPAEKPQESTSASEGANPSTLSEPVESEPLRLGNSKDVHVKRVQGVVTMMGQFAVAAGEVPAGNLVGLVGVDQYLLKSGTVTTCETAHNIVTMKYSVSPVVRVAVDVVRPSDLAKLTLGLKRLAKSDPLVQVYQSNTGEHIVAGSGELHLEICLKNLSEKFMNGCEIKQSQPVVPFCETISEPTSMTCISKSSNKHNRIFMTAQPLDQKFCEAVESGEFDLAAIMASSESDRLEEDEQQAEDAAESKKVPLVTFEQRKKTVQQALNRRLVAEFGWDPDHTKRIWCFGCPPDGQANVLVDLTRGAAYLSDVKGSFIDGFNQATSEGVFAGEPLRGIRFNMQDVKIHPDAAHHGAGQVTPAFKRAVYACQMASGPRLMEPMFNCEITAPRHASSGVFSCLQQRRALIVGQDDSWGSTASSLMKIKAHLPVVESFGFTDLLRKETGGQAFPQMTFSHWQILPGDLNDPKCEAAKLVLDIRKRKGLQPVLPVLADYHQKL